MEKKRKLSILALIISLVFCMLLAYNSSSFGIKPIKKNSEFKISLLDDNEKDHGFVIYEIRLNDKIISVDDLVLNNGWEKSDTKLGYPLYIDSYKDDNYILFNQGLNSLFADTYIKIATSSELGAVEIKYDGGKREVLKANDKTTSIKEKVYKNQKFINVFIQYVLLIFGIIGIWYIVNLIFDIFIEKNVDRDRKLLKYTISKSFLLIIFLVAISVLTTLINPNDKMMLFGRKMGRYEYFMFVIFSWSFSLFCKDIIKKHHRFSNTYSLFMILINPIISFLICEMAYNPYIYEMKPVIYFINYVILFIIEIFFMFVFRSRKISALIVLWSLLSFGMANQVLVEIRRSPLVPEFFQMIGVAMNVAGDSNIVFSKSSIEAFCYAIIWGYMLSPITDKKYKGLSIAKYLKTILVYLAFVFGLNFLVIKYYFYDLTKLDFNLWRPVETYYNNGTPFGFYALVENRNLKKPKGYDEKEVINILEKYRNMDYKSKTNADVKKPNVVVILSESLNDMQGLGGNLYFSEDPLSFTKSIRENSISGYINTSVLGGGTIKSEYEVITGNSLASFLPGSNPSNQFIENGSNSIVKLMKNQGYYTYATHPEPGSNYSRDKLWKYLGVDEMEFIEGYEKNGKIPKKDMIREYVSDRKVYEKGFNKLVENENSVFEFIVTMQNHGSYTGNYEKKDIKLKSFLGDSISKNDKDFMEEYVNLIKDTDKANEEYYNKLLNFDEPTIICMFGDHQIQNANVFFDYSYRKLNIIDSYTSPFFIWANYDINEKDDMRISLSYLSAVLFDNIGKDVKVSPYQRYLLDLMKEYPSITTFFALDKNGDEVENDEKFLEKKNELDKLIYFNVTNPKKAEKYFSKPVK